MRHVRSNAEPSRSWTRRLGLGLLVAALGATPGAQAHSLHVAQHVAATGGAAHALELRLDDPARVPPADAYVAIGPEQGLSDETAVGVALSLDLGHLRTIANDDRPTTFYFLRLATAREPGSTKLVLFLSRDPQGGWSLGAWTWDDTQGRYTLAGQAPLRAGSAARASAVVRVALEWSAASESAGRAQGSLRLARFDDHGQRSLLFERVDLDNASQRVNHLQLGVRAADPGPGLAGALGFDDVAVYRHTASAATDDASDR